MESEKNLRGEKMMATQSWTIGEHTVATPIVQGGMGVGISLAGLASAVARAGGIGTISPVGMGWEHPEWKTAPQLAHAQVLQQEIRKALQAAPNGVIAVNIMMALSNAEELMVAATEAGAHVLFIGAGLALSLPEQVLAKGKALALAPIVSSGRAARLIRDSWLRKHGRMPDAFVVEGPMAGGHLGFKRDEIESPNHTLEKILDDVLSVAKECELEIPVIAGGGIFTADDVKKYMNLGATAVQLGTRFVATHECDASLEFKQSYVNSKKEDITIIASPVGLPGRALRSQFLQALETQPTGRIVCRYRCLRTCNPATTPYCIAQALSAAKKGDFNEGFAFCGENAHRITEIISVGQLMAELTQPQSAAN
jgi:nitronate monooxygenase